MAQKIMRKEPLVFNKEYVDYTTADYQIGGLEMIEPFGVFVFCGTAYYTTKSLWLDDDCIPDCYFYEYALDTNRIIYTTKKSIRIGDISIFLSAMSKEEQEQFYLNLPELTELLKL